MKLWENLNLSAKRYSNWAHNDQTWNVAVTSDIFRHPVPHCFDAGTQGGNINLRRQVFGPLGPPPQKHNTPNSYKIHPNFTKSNWFANKHCQICQARCHVVTFQEIIKVKVQFSKAPPAPTQNPCVGGQMCQPSGFPQSLCRLPLHALFHQLLTQHIQLFRNANTWVIWGWRS